MEPALVRFFSLVIAAWTATANAASADGIALSAPLSGPSAVLGEQMRQGASAAATLLGRSLQVEDDGCTAEGGAAAARKFVDAQISIVVGYLCTQSIEAALPILKTAGIPVLAMGVRTDSLTDRREKTGWPVFRLGPRADSERNAAAEILTRLWRDRLFAIVDDGTIYGRELAETFRLAAEQSALKPVFVDTFRPQMDNQVALVGRLRKAGATHVFVGGDREDIAIIGRDAQQLGTGLIIAGGETLRAAPGEAAVTEGTLMISMPEWAEVADDSAIEAIRAAGGFAEGYALPAFSALQLADAVVKAQPDGPLAALANGPFTTAIGPIQFDAKGDLSQNPYRLYRFEGGRFVPMPAQ